MDTDVLIDSLASLTADLSPAPGSSAKDLTNLKKELAASLISQPLDAMRSASFSSGAGNAALFSEAHISPLKQVITAAVKNAEKKSAAPVFKSFERTMPVITDHLDGSVPVWAKGAAVDHSIGPFVGADGIKKWFDFYPITTKKQVKIFITDVNHPLLVLTLIEFVFFPAGQLSYSIPGSSVWIEGTSLSTRITTPDAFSGIKVKSGKINFSKLPTPVGDDFQIDNSTKITLTFEPDPNIITTSDPTTGLDATNAVVNFFSSATFEFIAGKGKLADATASSFTVYGSTVTMDKPDAAAEVTYLEELGGIFIAFQSPTLNFSFNNSLSPYCNFSGLANVLETGWFLPVSMTTAAQLADASGTGELGFAGSGNGKINWKGLAGDGLKIQKLLLLVAPGAISVTVLSGKNAFAKQDFNLWEEDTGKKRFSTASVFFTQPIEIKYISSSIGIEILNAVTNATLNIDRPLAAHGGRLRLMPRKANFYLIQLADTREVFLFDSTLLSEFTPVEQFEIPPRVPLALRNAFFSASQPEACILGGTLTGDNDITKGTLGVLFGVFEMYMTLPDPYVTSQPLLMQRNLYADDANNQPSPYTNNNNKILELMAFVDWPEPASPALDFRLAPISQQTFTQFLTTFLLETIETPQPSSPDNATPISAPLSAESFNALPLSIKFDKLLLSSGIKKEIDDTAAKTPESVLATAAIKKAYGDIYTQLTNSVVSSGQLLLLDVSSNADQMGVGFSYAYGRDNLGKSVLAGGLPLQAKGMDIIASGVNVRAFTLPHIQWEPVRNIKNPDADPPSFPDPIIFANDGAPLTIMTANKNTVALEPKKVIHFIEGAFNDKKDPQPAAAYFTLPFGMFALSFFSNKVIENYPMAAMDFNRPQFDAGPKVTADVTGGIQLKTTSFRPTPNPKIQDPYFYGYTIDTPNLGYELIEIKKIPKTDIVVPYGMLGGVVDYAFNNEFHDSTTCRVPLRRIDFSGYGVSIFSDWTNPIADFGMTTQAKFNVMIGRTALEVVQIKAKICPFAVPAVRTITIQRLNNSKVTRYDSGWQPIGPGVYDYSYFDQAGNPVPSPYTFHPGVVKGVYNVREIKDTKQRIPVSYVNPKGGYNVNAMMESVWYDCDVYIDSVTQGAVVKPNGQGTTLPLVLSRRQLGFILLGDPAHPEPLPATELNKFLKNVSGPLGGPVDCVVNIANSSQLMRLSRVDVNHCDQSAGDPLCVSAGRGTMILPKDGAWSIAIHETATDKVSPVDVHQPIPLIRFGKLDVATNKIADDPNKLYRIADPADITELANPINEYGLLQNTGTQKLLFRQPGFKNGVKELQSLTPNLADSYRLVNSKSIFPNIADTIGLPTHPDIAKLDIIAEGMKFKDSVIDKLTDFVPAIPGAGRFDIINTPAFKIYILYSNPADAASSTMTVDLNSNPSGTRKNWATVTKGVSMVVDLGPFSPLLTVTGDFNASFGEAPGFSKPKIVLNDALQKIKDILQLIATLSTDPDYLEIIKEGMQIAMSNSADSWDYKLHAVQEIPVLKFPPLFVEDAGPPPLKLQAGLRLGFYFNETLKPTTDVGSLLPSSGAFVEFFGQLSIMVLSLEVATIYAIGTTTLRVSSDTTDPAPVLDFTFGFGAEIVIQLPVVARVSVSFIISIGIRVQSGPPRITAGFIYKGVADICDGLVVITIFIEAHGSIQPRGASITDGTTIQADVTFGIDICIFLVIDINFTKTWSETRQIA